MTARKLADLGRLTEAAFLAEQAKLARLTRREGEIRAQLAQLLESRAQVANDPREIGEAALSAGADVRWHHWIATRQTCLNGELLQVIALKNRQIDVVRKAYGRAQALDMLTQRAQTEDRRKLAQRQQFSE